MGWWERGSGRGEEGSLFQQGIKGSEVLHPGVVGEGWWERGGGRGMVGEGWWERGGGRGVVGEGWWERGGGRGVVGGEGRVLYFSRG